MMIPFDTEVIDYNNKLGSVSVSVGIRNHEPSIRLTASDCDGGSIVYPTIEQAQDIVIALLTAIREIKHGPQT